MKLFKLLIAVSSLLMISSIAQAAEVNVAV